MCRELISLLNGTMRYNYMTKVKALYIDYSQGLTTTTNIFKKSGYLSRPRLYTIDFVGIRTEWRHTRNGNRVSPFSVCHHSMRSVHCMATRNPITYIMSFSSQSKVVWVMFRVLESLKSYPLLPTTPIPPLVRPASLGLQLYYRTAPPLTLWYADKHQNTSGSGPSNN